MADIFRKTKNVENFSTVLSLDHLKKKLILFFDFGWLDLDTYVYEKRLKFTLLGLVFLGGYIPLIMLFD